MKWIENYRYSDRNTLLGKFFQRLFFTWMYKIIFAIFLVLIAAIAFNYTKEGSFWDNIFISLYGVGLIILVVIAAIFMVYAWIINPIKSLIDKRKKKKELIEKIKNL